MKLIKETINWINYSYPQLKIEQSLICGEDECLIIVGSENTILKCGLLVTSNTDANYLDSRLSEYLNYKHGDFACKNCSKQLVYPVYTSCIVCAYRMCYDCFADKRRQYNGRLHCNGCGTIHGKYINDKELDKELEAVKKSIDMHEHVFIC